MGRYHCFAQIILARKCSKIQELYVSYSLLNFMVMTSIASKI